MEDGGWKREGRGWNEKEKGTGRGEKGGVMRHSPQNLPLHYWLYVRPCTGPTYISTP